MMLLWGVMIFSVIMGEYSELLEKFKAREADFNDGDALVQFFNVIKRFNRDEAMSAEKIKKLEDYFYYRWDKDKNLAFDDEEDTKLLETLPIGL